MKFLVIASILLLCAACDLTPEQKQQMKALSQASACLTESGCAGQPRYENSRNGIFKSAITISSTGICPRDGALGRFSHSTVSGFNRICYYS